MAERLLLSSPRGSRWPISLRVHDTTLAIDSMYARVGENMAIVRCSLDRGHQRLVVKDFWKHHCGDRPMPAPYTMGSMELAHRLARWSLFLAEATDAQTDVPDYGKAGRSATLLLLDDPI